MEHEQEPRRQNLVISALTLPRISIIVPSLITGLFLIEISETFGTPLGLTNQIKAANSVVWILAALSTGVLSMRYNHKKLLIAGISISIFTIFGCFMAPSFMTLAVAYALGGLAGGVIYPMTTSLIGEYVPPENSSKVLGWMISGSIMIYVVGSPIINYIGDWRNAFLYFALPVVIFSLVLCQLGLPPSKILGENVDMTSGIKGVLSSKSAVACLVSYGLSTGVWSLVVSLYASFYREQINVSRDLVSLLTIVIALCYVFGALLADRFNSRLGMKRTVYVSLFLVGVGTVMIFFISDLYVNFSLLLVATLLAGVMDTYSQNLILVQLPELRGSMMSLSSASSNLGAAVSLIFSGFLLVEFGWGIMGAIIGFFGLVAAALIYFYVSEK